MLLNATTRLYFASIGHPCDKLWTTNRVDPEVDQDLLLAVIEEARNAWTVWLRGSGSHRLLEPPGDVQEAIPDTERIPR